MSTRKLILQGLLGEPSEWSRFLERGWLHVNPLDMSADSLDRWASQFNAKEETTPAQTRYLMGYSFGGRLSLHCLIANPTLWQAAILISTHPGLSTRRERSLRAERDLHWSNRFLQEPGDQVLSAWNQQTAFNGDQAHPTRSVDPLVASRIAAALQWGSLGKQENLAEQISALPIPVLWITGEQDAHYARLATSVRLSHPLSRKCTVPGAGHRLFWTHSTACYTAVNEFLSSLDPASEGALHPLPQWLHKS